MKLMTETTVSTNLCKLTVSEAKTKATIELSASKNLSKYLKISLEQKAHVKHRRKPSALPLCQIGGFVLAVKEHVILIAN
jgi:hypothetical protein